jgi:hypothetical protein
MRKVPKKNIASHIRDIFHPERRNRGQDEKVLRDKPDIKLNAQVLEELEPPRKAEELVAGAKDPEIRTFPIRRFVTVFLVVAGGLFFIGGITTYYARVHERELVLKAAGELEELQSAVPDVKSLNFEDAQKKVRGSREDLARYAEEGWILSPGGIGDIWGFLRPAVKSIGALYGDFQEFSGRILELLGALDTLQTKWPEWLLKQGGHDFIATLEKIRDNLVAINDVSSRLNAPERMMKEVLPVSPGDYLGLQIEANRAKNFLDDLIPWLKHDGDRRFALFFMNSAELRPGGGFTGSYAEIILRQGSITDIVVRDINEADRFLEKKIVPPKPLQALVRRLRAADANWFFDFAASAGKTIELLEASELYRSEQKAFDGAFGITPRVVSDLLAFTGPIELPDSKFVVNSENVFTEIQREVQEDQAAGKKNTKTILQKLTPALMARLAADNSWRGKSFIERAGEWFEKKDAMVYFREPALQNFFDSLDMTGRVFDTPLSWNGDYLAVVHANIGGGKSDYAMKQEVKLESQIEADGTVTNRVVIRRTHAGRQFASWWYRETNQDYLKLFTPLGAQLAGASGVWDRKVASPVNYEREGYAVDENIKALESTLTSFVTHPGVVSFIEAGKNVFGAWSRTALGGTSELIFDYAHHAFAAPSDGGTYNVVLEKQSGGTGSYEVQINAPVGFHWRENGSPVFEYKTDDLPGRVILSLTFEKVL